jgi:hypothetical protein
LGAIPNIIACHVVIGIPARSIPAAEFFGLVTLPFSFKSILILVDIVTAISLAGGYQGDAQYFRNPRLTSRSAQDVASTWT